MESFQEFIELHEKNFLENVKDPFSLANISIIFWLSPRRRVQELISSALKSYDSSFIIYQEKKYL